MIGRESVSIKIMSKVRLLYQQFDTMRMLPRPEGAKIGAAGYPGALVIIQIPGQFMGP